MVGLNSTISHTRHFASTLLASAVLYSTVVVSAAAQQVGELSYLRAEWDRGRAQLQGTDPGCVLGLQVEHRGQRIIGLYPPADQAGFERGDALLAVNAMRLADGAAYELFVAGLAADAVAMITVVRDDEQLDIRLPCSDRRIGREQFVAALTHAIAGRYTECLNLTNELDRISGPQVGHAKLRYECAIADRLSRGQRLDRDDAERYFEVYRRLAAPARYSSAYRETVRERVERAAARFRKRGSNNYADRLLETLNGGSR